MTWGKNNGDLRYFSVSLRLLVTQLTFTCSKSTIETLKGVKHVHS